MSTNTFHPNPPSSTTTLGSEQDVIPPSITIVSPANATTITSNSVYINASISETPNTCLLEWNNVNETMTSAGSGANSYCYKNKTALADSTYSFRVWANDASNNWNKSETRAVTVSTAQNVSIYTRQFTVPSNVTKLKAGVNWFGLNAGASCTISLVKDSTEYAEYSVPTFVREFQSINITLPLINYTVLWTSGYREMTINNPATGSWVLKVQHNNVTSFDTIIGWS